MASSCRTPLSQADAFLRNMSSYLTSHGCVPVDDATIVSLVHHTNAVKTTVLAVVSSAVTATPSLQWDVYESAAARSASQLLAGGVALGGRDREKLLSASHALAEGVLEGNCSGGLDVLVVWSEVWQAIAVAATVVHAVGLAHAHVSAELTTAVRPSPWLFVNHHRCPFMFPVISGRVSASVLGEHSVFVFVGSSVGFGLTSTCTPPMFGFSGAASSVGLAVCRCSCLALSLLHIRTD